MAIKIDDARKRQAKQALEAKFREALESGPATPMTRDDWQQLRRNVWERKRQHETHEPGA